MNARDNTPLRSKIAAHLDVVREADANAIGKAIGLSARPSVVIKELNAMRTDALIECERRGKGKDIVYWLSVPAAEIQAAPQDGVARTLPDGIREGSRGSQIWRLLTASDVALTAKEIASKLHCVKGQIDPLLTKMYGDRLITRAKNADGFYSYEIAAEDDGCPASDPDCLEDANACHDDCKPVCADIPAPQYTPDAVGFDPVKRAEAEKSRAAELQQDVSGLMSVIYDVRVAIGDPEGKVMLGELAQHVAEALKLSGEKLDHERGVSRAACSSLAAVARHLCLPADAVGHRPIIDAIEGFRGEHDETVRQFAILKARHDDYEQAIANIHRACGDAGIAEGHVAERVVKLAETVKVLRDTVHKITEGDDGAVDVLQAASGFVVLASKRKPRRLKKPEIAREAALSAIRSGAQRATVFALVPVGEARRGAEWRDS